MSDSYNELMDEARGRVTRLEAELASVRDQLATSLAMESQLRQELETARTEAAVTVNDLAHARRQFDERHEHSRHRIADLEDQLDEARRLRRTAEQERAAVIAALGRKARRHLEQPAGAPDGATTADVGGD